MTLKRLNVPDKKEDPDGFNYEQEHQEITDSLKTSSDMTNVSTDDVANKNAELLASIDDKVIEQVRHAQNILKKQEQDNTMTAVPASEYTGPTPGIHVTASTDNKAYQGPLSHREKEDLINRFKAHTATKEDMALMDESMIFDLSFIKASDFSIPGQYDPKPIDPEIRFRWVNCVNALQSNMQRFLALGFTMATPVDVDQVRTPLAESMIQGNQIKQYDVVLMKIPVLALMSLYKRNMLVSASKLDMVREGGIAAANQTFQDLVGQDPMARSGYNKVRAASGKEPVTFTRT